MKYKYNLGADAALYNQLCTDKKLDPADYNIFYHNSSGGAGRISLHDIHDFFINHSVSDNKIIINTINSDHVSNSHMIERIYNEFYQKITFYKKAIAIIGVMQGDKKIAIEDFNLSAEQQKDIRLETMCCDNLAAGIKHYEKYIKRLSAFIKTFDCVMCLASGAEKSDFTERKKTSVDFKRENVFESINYISDQDTPEKADNTPEKPEQVQTPEKAEKQAEKAKTALKTEDVEQVLKTLDLSETWAQSIDLFNAAAKVLHPAHGGNENTWNKLVDKFNYVYDVVKDWHKRPGGSSYRAKMQETASEIVNIIDTINRCKGLDLETVGRFMWCKGSQLDYKKVLTDLGFTYQKDKRKFCKSYKGYKRTGGKGYSYASICRRYAEDTSV